MEIRIDDSVLSTLLSPLSYSINHLGLIRSEGLSRWSLDVTLQSNKNTRLGRLKTIDVFALWKETKEPPYCEATAPAAASETSMKNGNQIKFILAEGRVVNPRPLHQTELQSLKVKVWDDLLMHAHRLISNIHTE